jgi:hypothetical protein
MIRTVLLWPLKVGVIALILWFFLREPLPTPADWIVALVAAVLLHLAYAAVMTEIRRSGDSRLLAKAGFGEPPADGKRTAFIGTLQATGPVLRAPFSGAECVGYSYEISHLVYSRNANRTTSRKVTDFSGVALAPCAIHTIQGDFRLLSYPFLSGFPERTYKDQAHRDHAAEYIRATSFERVIPFVGELAALNTAMLETEGSLKRDWRTSDSDELGESTLEEQIIPADSKVCAFGIYSDAKRTLAPDTSSDERSLLLVAGDAEQAMRQLTSGIRSSRRVAFWASVPTAAVLAFILFAPWNMIRAVPGGSLIVEKQEQRLKDALGQNDVHEIASAIRYLDPNLTFEEAARTPLMLATSVEAARLLLDRGASVSAHDANGYSVLMNAAERGSPALLQFLASRGANLNEHLSSDPGTTPLSIARDRNTPAAVEALVKAGARDAQ